MACAVLNRVWTTVSRCLERMVGNRRTRMPLCVFMGGVK